MPIFTKNGKILFVDGKVATDEACCCDEEAIFHIAPNSVLPDTCSDGFPNIFKSLYDTWNVEENGTATVTKSGGYIELDAPAHQTNAKMRPRKHKDENNAVTIKSSDGFVARANYEDLSIGSEGGASASQFEFSMSLDEDSYNTNVYFSLRKNDTYRIFSAATGTVTGTHAGGTSGYVEISRSSGTLSFILDGVTLASGSDTNVHGVAMMLVQDYFGAAYVKITDYIMTVNGDDVYIDQNRWVDIVNPGVNDAVHTDPIVQASDSTFWPIYVLDVANGYDGCMYGGPYTHHTPQTIDVGAMTVYFAFKNIASGGTWIFGYSANPLTEQFIIDYDGDNIRVRGSQNGADEGEIETTNAAIALDTVYIVAVVISGSNSRIYVDGALPTYTSSMRDAGTYKFVNPLVGGQGTGDYNNLRTELLELEVVKGAASAATVLASYNEWQPKYNPTP